MNRDQRNFYATILAFASGFLFLLSGTNGYKAWKHIEELVMTNINLPEIKLLFTIILILASFGGLTVLFGAWLMFKEHIRAGRIFVSIGAGSGIIFLAVNIFTSIVSSEGSFSWLLSLSSLAIILSVFARYMAKPSRK